jgi:hypothetical protein
MKIIKINASNDCGGFKPPKGHLDTQMYPECEGYETDRDIVKKTEEKRKKNKKKKKASFNLREYKVAQKANWQQKLIDSPEAGMGCQVADVTLLDGTVYKDVAITNGEHISRVPGYPKVPFSSEDIADVVVANKRGKTNGKYRLAQVEEEYEVNYQNWQNPTELVTEAVMEAWEDSEEDIKVNDDGEAFYAGKLIAQPDANYGTDFVAIRKWMEKNNYFPNVWVANDHGNVSLFSVDKGGKETYRGGLV